MPNQTREHEHEHEHGHSDHEGRMSQLTALRKEAGARIDPETAEVFWSYEQTLDPYGDGIDLPEYCWQVGREYFARAPGSDMWVWFGHLPRQTSDRLWAKHRSTLAFPAGLPI